MADRKKSVTEKGPGQDTLSPRTLPQAGPYLPKFPELPKIALPATPAGDQAFNT
jgi:hypothetical protein